MTGRGRDRRKVIRRRMDRRREWVHRGSLAALVVLYILGFRTNGHRVTDIQELQCGAHRDKVTRLANSRDYLASPESRATPALNRYIKRISLPQLEQEIEQERKNLPSSCTPTPTPTPNR